MRRSLLALTVSTLIVLAGCSSLPTPPSNPTPGEFYSLWGVNQAPRMVIGSPYAIPNAGGLVGYVQTAWDGKAATIASTMSLTFTIADTAHLTATVVDPYAISDVDPPALRLFIELPDDNFTQPDERWWCTANKFNLTADGTFTVSCVLDYRLWTNVDGRHVSDAQNPTADQITKAQTAFESAVLSEAQYAGFTFGGQNYAGHGVGCTGSNTCTFTLDSFSVE
jgi:hypothetical protein